MLVKKWTDFQHYKPESRNITWIKLHKKLLDDPEWSALDPQAAKVLVMLWLLASEDNGRLPDVPEIAFRLRMPKNSIESTLCKLSHWLEQDASKMLAGCEQAASLELELDKNKNKKEAASKMLARACTWPEDFELTSRLYDYAREQGIDKPAKEFEHFHDNAMAKGYKYVNWEKAWQNWCRSPYQQKGIQEKNEVKKGSGLKDYTPRPENSNESMPSAVKRLIGGIGGPLD